MINKVVLVGGLGEDPKVVKFDNGNIVCTFNLATSEHRKCKDTGEHKQLTQWHNIRIKSPPICKFAQENLRKGDQIYIEGKIIYHSWEDDGKKRYRTNIVLEDYQSVLRRLSK